MISTILRVVKKTTVVDFRKWLWQQDVCFQFYHLFCATLLTLAIIFKNEGHLFPSREQIIENHENDNQVRPFDNAWSLTFIPVWFWGVGLLFLLLNWCQNNITLFLSNFVDDDSGEGEWSIEDKFFLRSFSFYFAFLFPVVIFFVLLALKLDQHIDPPIVAITIPLIFSFGLLSVYSITKMGGYFIGALFGCVPSPSSKPYYTLFTIVTPLALIVGVVLYVLRLDQFKNSSDVLVSIGLGVFALLNVLIFIWCFIWYKKADDEDKNMIVSVTGVTFVAMCIELAFFWNYFSDTSDISDHRAIIYFPILLLEGVLWAMLAYKVDAYNFIFLKNFLETLGFSFYNYLKMVINCLLFIFTLLLILKQSHALTWRWVVAGIPLYLLDCVLLFNIACLYYKSKRTDDSVSDEMYREAAVHHITFSIPFLLGGLFYILLAFKLDGTIGMYWFLVSIPILLAELYLSVYSSFKQENYSFFLFMISCYDGVDDILSTPIVRLVFTYCFSLTCSFLVLFHILYTFELDGLIVGYVPWYSFHIFGGFLLLLSFSLLFIFVVGTESEKRRIYSIFSIYIAPFLVLLAIALIIHFTDIDFGEEIFVIPILGVLLYNTFKAALWQTPAVPDQPPPPQLLNFANEELTLYLIPPPSNGATVTEYVVEVEEVGTNTRNVIYSGPHTLVLLRDVELSPGVEHYFYVKAKNAVGFGPTSQMSAPLIIKSTRPDQPEAPTASQTENGILIKWSPPFDNSYKITHYSLLICENNSCCERYVQVDASMTYFELTELKVGVEYNVSVKAINPGGESKWSPPIVIECKPLKK